MTRERVRVGIFSRASRGGGGGVSTFRRYNERALELEISQVVEK
tara:strand:+ start:2135 stop:2266 length:132 start_codon:yes stop_codon:yes gene_type:complete